MENINFSQLKRLWNLKLVIEMGSIKKAATRANVTSSAMSQSISGLEGQVGRKLVLRKKEMIVPTEYGAKLIQSADSAFGVCFDLQQSLNGGCKIIPKMDWLDLAITESLAVDVIPETMKRLKTQFPSLRLKVKSGRSTELTKAVKSAELCMAVVEENEYMKDVMAIPLAEERLGLYGSPKLANRKACDLIDTLGIGTISCGSDGHPSYHTKFVRTLGKSLKSSLTSDSYEVLRVAAAEGSVLAVLPSRVALRKRNELIEFVPDREKPLTGAKNIGRYGIYLVCEPGCSTEENEFLAMEMKSIISATH